MDRTADAHRLRPLPLLAICAGFFMIILDTTIVNAALPVLRRDLGTGVSGLEWVVNGYTLVFAALLLSGGALGDRLGSHGVFMTGVALFGAASAACALAPDTAVLVLARAAQGAGAALCVPTSLALLRASAPDAAARARAVGVWGGVGGVAAASGPVLGGLLTGWLGWRAVFAVNPAVAVACLVLTARHVPRPAADRGRGLDPLGQALALVALGALSLGLIEAGVRGFHDPLVLGSLAVALGAAAAFVAAERRCPDPMLPPALFTVPALRTGTAVGLLINLGFYGQLFVVNLALQQLRGMSPLVAGLALLPEAGLVSLGSLLSGRLTGVAGPRPAMLVGLGCAAAGLVGLALAGAQAPYAVLVAPLAATGFGMSFTMPAATSAVVDAAPVGRAALASGVINAARQAGGLIGVAVLGGLVARRGDFETGLHTGLLAAAGAFGLGGLLTLITRMPRPGAAAARSGRRRDAGRRRTPSGARRRPARSAPSGDCGR
jgi:DHA2 family methylenomycin A resistance protein-like MFS transporter